MNFNEFLPKELVRKLSGFFFSEQNCRGYDPNTPIGEIANHAFLHWRRHEQEILELEQIVKTKSDLLEIEKGKVANLNRELNDQKRCVRKIKKIMYKSIANWASVGKYFYDDDFEKWEKVETKCRKMAEKFKE